MPNNLISRAAAFAKTAHESIDQRRKYTNAPYIVHPEAVAGIVSEVTDDPVIIAAAWLHDVVEDTPINLRQIEAEFGAEVARLVDDLTDISRPSDGNREERVALDRRHTATADPRAKTVKLADVIHNLSDVSGMKRGYAAKYIGEKEQLLTVLKEGNRQLYERAKQTINDARQQIDASTD